MACPYFYPQKRFADKGKHPRLPLGDPYEGLCMADPMRSQRPEESVLRESCNLGYARGKCARFPGGAGPDAIRFSVTGDENGLLKIFYVSEQNHKALQYGTLEYSVKEGKLLSAEINELLHGQVQAYVESYLRRQREPEALAKNPHRR